MPFLAALVENNSLASYSPISQLMFIQQCLVVAHLFQIFPITAFLVDRCQNVYVSGWGGKFNNDRGYPMPVPAVYRLPQMRFNLPLMEMTFISFVLEKNAVSQLFGSFYGQRGGFDDHVDGGTSRFDANGIIYQAHMCKLRRQKHAFGGIPNYSRSLVPKKGSNNCNEALVKIEMNFGGIGASIKATIRGVIDTVGCVPLTVTFTDTLAREKDISGILVIILLTWIRSQIL
jgi:hypothetical protein